MVTCCNYRGCFDVESSDCDCGLILSIDLDYPLKPIRGDIDEELYPDGPYRGVCFRSVETLYRISKKIKKAKVMERGRERREGLLLLPRYIRIRELFNERKARVYLIEGGQKWQALWCYNVNVIVPVFPLNADRWEEVRDEIAEVLPWVAKRISFNLKKIS